MTEEDMTMTGSEDEMTSDEETVEQVEVVEEVPEIMDSPGLEAVVRDTMIAEVTRTEELVQDTRVSSEEEEATPTTGEMTPGAEAETTGVT